MEKPILDSELYEAKARETIAEGIVLLRNENGALPFKKGTRVAVFGRSQFNYYKSGTGSGGMVNTRPVPGIPQALKESGDVEVDAGLEAVYGEWLKDHPFDEGVGRAAEPWYQEEMSLSDELVSGAVGRNDAALVILGRTAGEDKDNSAAEGSYLLTRDERSMLEKVCGAFSKVVVVLNVSNIIDMKWVEEYRPQAVLYVWQGGQAGGLGTADVLTGRSFPSGRLPDTIALSIEDYPAAANYGSEKENFYAEDVYVGYRYFETFAPEKVLYPFGFGLSYTAFEIGGAAAVRDGDCIRFSATVKNTGGAPGKEVVQVYCEAPQGRLGKPARALCAFGKTKTLAPGESETLSLSCPLTALASYDDSGAAGHRSCWVLEEGEYGFAIGSDVRSAPVRCSVFLPETVLEQLEEALAPVKPFERLRPGARKPSGVYEKDREPAPLSTVDPLARRNERLPAELPQTGDRGIRLIDVLDGKATLEELVAQLSDEDLICIVRGEGMCSPRVTPGTAGAFGGVTDELLGFGIPTGCCADGPSGIRMDCGAMAFAMPNGTLLASTFNTELVSDLFRFEGLELRKNRVDTLLGPGINLHRHPLNGRNFEYFSEDPLLTGKMTAAQLLAMQEYGVTGTIKHFACNSQEFHRFEAEAVVSERALRELYLKGYEIAVKEGKARSVMTSYNPINGFWAAGNYDLVTTVLRGQWGFTGQVMSDWWARANNVSGGDGASANTAPMVRAQNDLYMVMSDVKGNSANDTTEAGLASGLITRGELQRSAMNICRFLLESPALLRMAGRETELDKALARCPGLDGSSAGEIVQIAVENDAADIDPALINTEKGASTVFAVNIRERGFYSMKITLRSTDPHDVSQLPLSIFRDGNLLTTVTVVGSEREWKTVEINDIEAFVGSFYLRFFFAQSGLELQSVRIGLAKSMESVLAAR